MVQLGYCKFMNSIIDIKIRFYSKFFLNHLKAQNHLSVSVICNFSFF